eukprot:7391807-Heterocapsa_arctica.AAC.1
MPTAGHWPPVGFSTVGGRGTAPTAAVPLAEGAIRSSRSRTPPGDGEAMTRQWLPFVMPSWPVPRRTGPVSDRGDGPWLGSVWLEEGSAA